LETSSRNGPTWSARSRIWWTCPDRITSQGGWIGRSSPKAATGISSRATECVDWPSSWPPRATKCEPERSPKRHPADGGHRIVLETQKGTEIYGAIGAWWRSAATLRKRAGPLRSVGRFLPTVPGPDPDL